RGRPDHHRDLGLAFEDGRRRVGQHHRVAVADNRGRAFVEGADRRLLRQRAVLHVVDRHADRAAGARHRRTQPDTFQRHALAVGGGFFDLGLVSGPALDQPDDDVARVALRDVLADLRDVDDLIALDDAQPEIVEITELHARLPFSRWTDGSFSLPAAQSRITFAMPGEE